MFNFIKMKLKNFKNTIYNIMKHKIWAFTYG